jgi:ribonuclease-3
VKEHNERLEFLGDSVLGLIISDDLYKTFPGEAEGILSQKRSLIVEASSCAAFVHKLKLDPYICLGKGESENKGRGRETILADLFEAIIGAIYVDAGFEKTQEFFWKKFKSDINDLISKPAQNWKAKLQDYSQKKYQTPPVYKVVLEEGPDHYKIFHVLVFLNEKEAGFGKGGSKKEAEQAAAQDALGRMNE